jgi:hypothetical protein
VLDTYADCQCVPQFDRNAAAVMGSIKLISEICERHDKKCLFLIWYKALYVYFICLVSYYKHVALRSKKTKLGINITEVVSLNTHAFPNTKIYFSLYYPIPTGAGVMEIRLLTGRPRNCYAIPSEQRNIIFY